VGNRLAGDRLSTLVGFDQLKLASAAVLLSPFVPMLFMGEEYGETAPFQYFVSHGDPNLVEGVRKGRAEEFKSFGWQKEVPDPQSVAVFEQSTLNWELGKQGNHQILRSLYKTLIQLRKTHPALASLNKKHTQVIHPPDTSVIILHRQISSSPLYACLNFNPDPVTFTPSIPPGIWTNILDSADPKWSGSGQTNPQELSAGIPITLSSWGFVLYSQS
jgi:maltooligosyltrehalose trehalohydrolase